jgi:hypothetical protein
MNVSRKNENGGKTNVWERENNLESHIFSCREERKNE